MRDSKEAVYDYLLSTLMSLMTETYFCTSLKHYICFVYNNLYLDTSLVIRRHVLIFVYAFGMVCDNFEQNLGIGIELFLCSLCI